MADITRNSFSPSKHYEKVILQQNVPWFDSDFNEAMDIIRSKNQNFIRSVVGDGSPNDGFKIVGTGASNDFTIKAGLALVNGRGCPREAAETYLVQGDWSTPTALTPPGSGTRTDTVYLHVYEQEVDSAIDPNIINPSYGSETCRRIRIRAQVKVAEGGVTPTNTISDWYLTLATILRTAGQAAINVGDVTDARLDISVGFAQLTAIANEVIAARGTMPNLNARMSVALNDDGTLKAELTSHAALTDMPDATAVNADHDARYSLGSGALISDPNSNKNILASNSNAKGASLVGIEDSGGFFAAQTVEAALYEIKADSVLFTDRLKVYASSTPDANVTIRAGIYPKSDGSGSLTFTQTTTAFSPVLTPGQSRVDLVTLTDSAAVSLVVGTPSVIPVIPTYPTADIVLAEVTVTYNASPIISQANIKDVRPWLKSGRDIIDNTRLGVDAVHESNLQNLAVTLSKLADAVQQMLPKPGAGRVVFHPVASNSPGDGTGDTQTPGWLKCDGRLMPIANYPALYSALGSGTVWGVSGGNFYLPDARGVVMRGSNDAAADSFADPDAGTRTARHSGGATGNNVGSYQLDTLIGHTNYLNPAAGALSGGPGAYYSYEDDPTTGNISSVNPVSGYQETRMKNMYVTVLVKI